MARIRQLNPQNYSASSRVNEEFESLIRYLNAAEVGDKTIGELLNILFDDDGEFGGPIEMRVDSSLGLQYRVGTYTSETEGWLSLASIASLRGEAGSNVGEIGSPILHQRADYTATAAQTDFDYAHDVTDEIIVYVNGILQVEGAGNDYQTDPNGGTGSAGEVTFNAGLNLNDVVTIYKIRSTLITGYTRTDTTTVSDQTVFPFTHEESDVLQVYKNGILQIEGGSNDYTTQPDQNTVTFNSTVTSGNTITIWNLANTSNQAVTGLMMESNYADPATGLIPFAKLLIADADIPQAKVSGLVTALSNAADLTVSASTPSSPSAGDLWVDTSVSPNALKFFDGVSWLNTTPTSAIPDFTVSNAGEYVRVNGTGTGYELGAIDFSAYIAKSTKAAANGVASLDSNAKLPSAQMPTEVVTDSMYLLNSGATANATYDIKRIYKHKISIQAIACQTSAGTCTVQVAVDGVGVGSTFSVSSTPNETDIGTAIEVDASSANKKISIIVTSASSAADLEVVLAYKLLSS